MARVRRSALANFHPTLQDWFLSTYGVPTDIQRLSWPLIRDRRHVLATAPTGSGKTMTAFLSALDDFATGRLETGYTQVLYVSPLRALNNDIQRNLLQPLEQLKLRFEATGEEFPAVRVLSRSGDTPSSARQRMLRRPPEILITTPESLNLLLTTVRGRQSLRAVRVVILDEIHSVFSNRRGTQLTVGLERLVQVAGEFQRIALSATVKPLEVVADFVGGRDTHGNKRTVEVVRSTSEKTISVEVVLPDAAQQAIELNEPIWDSLFAEFKTRIDANESTLIFANSRRQAEKVALGVNELAEAPLVYPHHGSLARELRQEVEAQLKSNRLKGVISTSSLELGIDIGALNEVVLLGSPPTVAATLQRIGRAGHRVGEVSRGRIYPTHARDFVAAAVLSRAVQERDIEPMQPIESPLDVLAQLIVSMVATEDWQVDELFTVVTRAHPYRELDEDLFQLVLRMLGGSYEGSRIRDLRPRVAIDEETRKVTARKGAALAFYASGGSIPDRGYYKLKTENDGIKLGELDEEFVWEAKIDTQFTFGSQPWRISAITHNDVVVKPAKVEQGTPPFYRSEFINRSFHFAQLEGAFLGKANEYLRSDDTDGLKAELARRGFDSNAASELTDFLVKQRRSSNTDLPTNEHVVAEHVLTGPAGYRSSGFNSQLLIHTCWGGMVNRPIAHLIETRWRKRFKSEPDVYADNFVIAVQLKHDVDPSVIVEHLSPAGLMKDLRAGLEGTGFFGGRFRECAGRALLLSKDRFDRRVPLWMTRQQAKQLLTAVSQFEDFPILLETWRTCLQDEFDLDAVQDVLADVESGVIRLSLVTVDRPSPFAADVVFDQVNRYMYADDQPERRATSSLTDELIAAAIDDATLRPPIQKEVIEAFERKLQRHATGYEPDDEADLIAWVKERGWISEAEWFAGVAVPNRLKTSSFHGKVWIHHPEQAALVEQSLATHIANALQFYGPRSQRELLTLFPVRSNEIERCLQELVADGTVLDDVEVQGESENFFCDGRNLDILLRLQRKATRASINPLSVHSLPAFWATLHQFDSAPTQDQLLRIVERLRDYTAPVQTWLRAIWNPRVGKLPMHSLDGVLREYRLGWFGNGTQRISLGFLDELQSGDAAAPNSSSFRSLFCDPEAQYSFLQLADRSSLPTSKFNELFWHEVWRGSVVCDSLGALEFAEARQFDLGMSNLQAKTTRRRPTRARFNSMAWRGNWRLRCEEDVDLLQAFERTKDRVRQLLVRYGFVCRELANREGGYYRWSAIFRAIRTMELSGELIAGHLVAGLSGPQFTRLDLLNAFERPVLCEQPFWINALDPVAPLGLGLDWPELPARRHTTALGFAQGKLLAVSEGSGSNLTFRGDPQDRDLAALMSLFHRDVGNSHQVRINEINGVPVRQSQYLDVLRNSEHFHLDPSSAYFEAHVG